MGCILSPLRGSEACADETPRFRYLGMKPYSYRRAVMGLIRMARRDGPTAYAVGCILPPLRGLP